MGEGSTFYRRFKLPDGTLIFLLFYKYCKYFVLTKQKSRYSIKTSQRKHTKQVGELGGTWKWLIFIQEHLD